MPTTLQRTPLHGRHVALGARMVPFAGWEMPVQYEGPIPEHRAVRTDAGVFDVSHMGQLEVEGPRALELLQGLLSNDLDRVAPGGAQYTLLTNERGGILDDLIAYRLGEHRFLLIVNASNREPDFEWIKEREIRGSDVRDVSDDYALLAVQGPRALERLGLPEAPAFTFAEARRRRRRLHGRPHRLHGRGRLRAARDGRGRRAALGLGGRPRRDARAASAARDSLRLEACYPLHGNDISPDTDAISAGLGWACALDKEFTGVGELRRIKAEGPARRLVPFVHGGARRAARGHGDPGGRRGHLGNAGRRCSSAGSGSATSPPSTRSPTRRSRSTCAAGPGAPGS